jgi:hypothetical protein
MPKARHHSPISEGKAMAANGEVANGRRGGRWRLAVWGTAALILLAPWVAMQFTSEMNWDETDFIFIGVMLGIACGTYELAARMTGSSAYRGGVGVAVVASFLLIWMNLAVGIIGNEENSLNLMYGGVLAVALVGAVIGAFKPDGMARAFTAAAVAQLAVGAVALANGYFTLALEGFFAAMWLTSAGLFRKAARE